MASVAKREWTYKGEQKTAWVVRYKDGAAHRSKQFEKKKDADAFRQKVEREIHSGVHVAATQSATVTVLFEAFVRAEELRLKDGRISTGHYVSLKGIGATSILPFIGHIRVNELTVNDVEDWYNSMVKVQGLSPGTAKWRIKFCHPMFDFAVQRGYAKATPLREGIRRLRGVGFERIRTFTVEEVGILLRAAEVRRHAQRDRSVSITRCFLHLAAFCGMRFGEIAGLKASNLDFDRRFILVRNSLSRFDGLKGPKTKAGIRNIPMPEHVAEMLRAHLAAYYRENEGGLLLTVSHSRGRDLPVNAIQHKNFYSQYWRPLLEFAGIDLGQGVPHFHALRHFASSWMIANQIPLMDVAKTMGHREFDTTLQVYAHSIVSESQLSSAFEKMATKLLDGGPIIEGSVVVPTRIAQGLRTGE